MIDDVLATLLTHGREVGPTIDSVEEEEANIHNNETRFYIYQVSE